MSETPIDVGSRRQLFLDQHLVAVETGLSRVLHHPKKRGLVIRREHPWEGMIIASEPVVRDERGRFHVLYGLYYYNQAGNPRDKAEQYTRYKAYAYSDDGVHWTKPMLRLVDVPAKSTNFPNPSAEGATRENNAGAPVAGVWDLCEHGNIDDLARRYLVVTDHASFNRVYPDFANDARWRERLTPTSPDLSKCPRTGTFTGIVGRDESGDWFGFSQGVRGRWIPSRDITRWHVGADGVWRGTPVLYPDAYDGHTRENYEEFMEFSTVWTGDAWLGFLVVFHSDRTSEEYRAPTVNAYRKGTTDLQLVTSRDHGRTWARVANRQTWLTHGEEQDDFDRMAYRGFPVEVGDETWFYYFAADGDHLCFHNVEGQPTYYRDRVRDGGLALATIRRDGYVSLRAGTTAETLVTKPLIFAGNRLLLNADCQSGAIHVEVVDAAPKPLTDFFGDPAIPELAFDRCQALEKSGVAQEAHWANGASLAARAGKPVRLRFRIRNADLYGFQFAA
jgi:hypothetical protein